jgi:hypothetical protein
MVLLLLLPLPLAGPAGLSSARTFAETGDACPQSAPAPQQTIRASRSIVVYGNSVALTGGIGRPMPNQKIALLLRLYGESSAKAIALVQTDANGRWRYDARPGSRSSYSTCWLEPRLRGQTVTVRVRPHVTLRRRGRSFSTKVIGARSFNGRKVFLQRKSGRKWRSIRSGTLRRRARRFRVELPRGSSRLRVLFPQKQAGPGYLAGFSRVLVVRR